MQSSVIIIVCFVWFIEQCHTYPKDSDEVDCSQFTDEADIIRRFPFPVTIYKGDSAIPRTLAYINEETGNIWRLVLYKEAFVPPSVYCLFHLGELIIKNTPFPDGNVEMIFTKMCVVTLFD